MDMRVLKGYRLLQSLEDGSLHVDTGTQCIPVMPVGGAKSWNDLEDKPFGDESVTIEWDGDTEGIYSFEWNGGIFAKVSELTPEPSELIGGSFSVINPSGLDTVSITEDIMADQRAEGAPVLMINAGAWFLCVIYEPFEADVIAEAGIYFTKVASNIYVSSLTYGSIKKLDPKYLPEGGVGYEDVTDIGDTLTWDGTPTDISIGLADITLERVSDSTPSVEELVGGSFVMSIIFNSTDGETNVNDSVEIELTSDNVLQANENFIVLLNAGQPNVGIALEDGAIFEVEAVKITFPKKGIYFIRSEDDEWDGIEGYYLFYISSLTIPNYNFTKTEVHKIDKKFLHDDIGGGLPVVELSTTLTGGITLTDTESALLSAAFNSRKPFTIVFDFEHGNLQATNVVAIPITCNIDMDEFGESNVIMLSIGVVGIQIIRLGGELWSVEISSMNA